MGSGLVVAISSCWRYEHNGWNDAMRQTWLKDLTVPYRFFHGQGEEARGDIVVVNAADNYESLLHKTLDKYRWVLANGYDSVFHCYHDTYACPERLVLPEGVDYFGDYYHADPRQPYPHGSYGTFCQSGAGVFISRRALEVVVDVLAKKLERNPSIWEEDLWTGHVIRQTPGLVIGDTREMPCNLSVDDLGPRRNNGIISNHLSTIHPGGNWDGHGRETEWKYRPEYMYKLHREWQES